MLALLITAYYLPLKPPRIVSLSLTGELPNPQRLIALVRLFFFFLRLRFAKRVVWILTAALSLSVLPPVTLRCEQVKDENMVEAHFVCTHVCLLVTLEQVMPLLQRVSVREIFEFLVYTQCETWKNYDSNRNREFFRFNFQEDH